MSSSSRFFIQTVDVMYMGIMGNALLTLVFESDWFGGQLVMVWGESLMDK